MPIDKPTLSFPADNGERDDSMAHLAVVLAHRLRGLVASIEGFTDLLNDTLQHADQRDLAMKIMEGTARIESVLSDLQLYGEHLDPVMLPVRVGEVLRDLFVPLDTDRRNVEITIAPEAADQMLEGDPFLLRQALLILVQNALESVSEDEGAALRVEADRDAVRFEIWNAGTIEIDDAEQVVFIPFFTTKAHNLGVGLSIARRIARLHGATLELSANDAELGTCFALILPVSDRPSP